MKRFIGVVPALCILLSLYSFKADQHSPKIRYHKIQFTASSIELIAWNIEDTTKTAFAKEFIDSEGRTTEIRFYNYAHKLDYAGSGFYGGPIIKYAYEDQKIIETFYKGENEIAHDFRTSEVPYRFIYQLNEKNEIVKIESKYIIEFDWTVESLESSIQHLEFYKKYAEEGSELKSVFGYTFSFNKMNGINPEK